MSRESGLAAAGSKEAQWLGVTAQLESCSQFFPVSSETDFGSPGYTGIHSVDHQTGFKLGDLPATAS